MVNRSSVQLYLRKEDSLKGFTIMISETHILLPQISCPETGTHFINDGVLQSNWQHFFLVEGKITMHVLINDALETMKYGM